MALVAKSRAIIINEGKVFLVFDAKAKSYMLPGGTHEANETMTECLEREITEELGIKPIISELISIKEYYSYGGKIAIEYCYSVLNNSDYLSIDKSKCTHGYEWTHSGFYDLDDLPKEQIKPYNLNELLNNFSLGSIKKVNYISI